MPNGLLMVKKITFTGLLSIIMLAGFAQANGSLPKVEEPKFKQTVYLITKNGALPDGYTLNTNAIQKTIDECNAHGGGTVQVPAGLWLTGPFVIKSNVNLNLSVGATLLFTKDKREYPLVKANWEGYEQMRNQSPISATNATNIAITGKGIIDGNGDVWRAVKKDKLTESQWKKLIKSGGVLNDKKDYWMPSESYIKGSNIKDPGRITADRNADFYQSVKDFLRPNLAVFTNCDKVLLEGVTFQNSPAWCLHPLMSKNITVRNVFVKNPWYAQNGDGIDLESCSDVLIENSVFDVGDDGLCMKSGRDADGRARAIPTKDVIIRGCTVYASHGGFVIGSEMSGGVTNIYVSDCTFVGSDIGLRFKSTRGRGGVVENIFVQNIFMKDIPGEAILFDMYYMGKDPVPSFGERRELPQVETLPVNETTPVFRNIHISNVYCNGAAKAIFMRGLPEMHIKNIDIENSVFQSQKGVDIQEASDISFKNVKVFTADTDPVIDIINSDKILFSRFDYSDKTTLLLRAAGDKTKAISMQQTDYNKAKEKSKVELGADVKAVILK